MPGDHVLATVAEILQLAIRKSDVAARFAGEEFVLLLVQCDDEHTLIRYADAALYRAKKEERNRTPFYKSGFYSTATSYLSWLNK